MFIQQGSHFFHKKMDESIELMPTPRILEGKENQLSFPRRSTAAITRNFTQRAQKRRALMPSPDSLRRRGCEEPLGDCLSEIV